MNKLNHSQKSVLIKIASFAAMAAGWYISNLEKARDIDEAVEERVKDYLDERLEEAAPKQ